MLQIKPSFITPRHPFQRRPLGCTVQTQQSTRKIRPQILPDSPAEFTKHCWVFPSDPLPASWPASSYPSPPSTAAAGVASTSPVTFIMMEAALCC